MFAVINGKKIYYTQVGTGPDLLLLHGWGYDSSLLARLAEAVSGKYRVTLADMPGHGQSAEPEAPMTVYDYADIALGLLDFLKIRRTFLLCHSFGGRLAIIMASRRPELFRKMIFCSAAGIRPKRTAKQRIRLAEYKIAKTFVRLFAPRKFEQWRQGKGSADYRALSPVMKATFSNIVNEDLTPLLPSVACPVFLIWGENDTATPLYMADIMEKTIPDCAKVVYAGRTHYGFLEELPRTVAILNTFFT